MPPPHKPTRVRTSADEPTTLIDLFKLVARAHQRPDTLNYKRNGQWVSISSDELLARAGRIAAGLYSVGLRHGDRLALLSESRVEWTLTDAGCIFAGIIDVPIYPTLTAPQVRYILRDSGASALVLESFAKFKELEGIVSECPQVRHVVVFESENIAEPNVLTLDQVEARGQQLQNEQPGIVELLSAQTTANDLATIIYTSGTTGEPKGVMLTHSNLVTNLIDSSGHLEFGEHDSALSVLPLSHVYERQAMYM